MWYRLCRRLQRRRGASVSNPQLRPIVRFATGHATCEETLPLLPFRHKHSPYGCPANTRACAVWRLCQLGEAPPRRTDATCIAALSDRSCGTAALKRVYGHGEAMATALRSVAKRRREGVVGVSEEQFALPLS